MQPRPRQLFLTLILSLILLLPGSASGQSEGRIAQLTVSFWPEFDQPAVLVIYQVQLPAETELPALVELPLPSEVSVPHAVANATEAGSLVNAEYELLPGDQGQRLQVTAETQTVWVEYYQDLNFNETERSFSYRWPGTEAVDEFNYEVQQPIGAQSLQLEPPADGQRLGADGLTYLVGSFGAVEQGEERSLEFSYLKTSDELTASGQPEAPLEGVSTSPPISQQSPGWLMPLLIGGALLLVAGGGYLIWRRRTSTPKRSPRRRRSRDRKPAQRFCHNCGKQVGQQDRFCRHCGVEQRSP